jgi:hypothetical protein
MITSTEIRHRKTILSTTPDVNIEEEQLVKKVEMPLENKNSSGWCSDGLIASLLFCLSLPIRFKNLRFPEQVV